MRTIINRRNGADRRTEEMKLPYNRRIRPDRRLNSISVEWIPDDEINLHPLVRRALSVVRKIK